MNNGPIAYGVWQRGIVDHKPLCLIYCPSCIDDDELDTCDELMSLNGDKLCCASCGIIIQDRKDPMADMHLCLIPRDGRDHTCKTCGATWARAHKVQLDGSRDFYKAIWNAINDTLRKQEDRMTRDDINYLYAALDQLVDAAYPIPEELAQA
jgi:hypothetical protein